MSDLKEQIDERRTPNEKAVENMENKTGYVAFPGWVNFVDERGSHTGCKAALFTSVTDLNQFCESHRGLLFAHVSPRPDGTIFALYTRMLTQEDQDLLNLQQADWEAFRAKKRKERDAADAKRLEAEEQAMKDAEAKRQEIERLVEVGRKCEHNHKKKPALPAEPAKTEETE